MSRSSSDRNIDQDDVEEEVYKEVEIYGYTSTKAFSMGDLMSSLPLHN
jgi:hypothetical protein